MTARQRLAGLALYTLFACLVAALITDSRRLMAQPQPVPAHTAQRGPVPSSEPPLADAVPPRVPVVPSPLPLAPSPWAIGGCGQPVPLFMPAPLPCPAPPPPAPPPIDETPCPIDPPTPVVAIRVRAPASSAGGREIEYRICIENCSDADAHHVVVRDPLPANARFVRASPEPHVREPELVWHLGSLEGGKCREITLVLCRQVPATSRTVPVSSSSTVNASLPGWHTRS